MAWWSWALGNPDTPVRWIWQDDLVVAFHEPDATHAGQVQVAPRDDVRRWTDLTGPVRDRLFEVGQLIAVAQQQVLGWNSSSIRLDERWDTVLLHLSGSPDPDGESFPILPQLALVDSASMDGAAARLRAALRLTGHPEVVAEPGGLDTPRLLVTHRVAAVPVMSSQRPVPAGVMRVRYEGNLWHRDVEHGLDRATPLKLYGVRMVFDLGPSCESEPTHRYEARGTMGWARTLADAIVWAEREADDYCRILEVTSLGLCQAFEASTEGEIEAFSLVRESSLDPEDYLDTFFDTGAEYQFKG